jgi:hypothetical protein
MADKKSTDNVAERAAKLSERDGIPFHKAISYVMNGGSGRPAKKAKRTPRKTSERDYE